MPPADGEVRRREDSLSDRDVGFGAYAGNRGDGGSRHDGQPRIADAPLSREESLRRARRRLLLALVGLASVVGVALLVERALGYRDMVIHLRRARPEWLLVAVGAEALAFAGYIWALRNIARVEGGPALRLVQSGRLVFASLGAGRVVAGGGVAGIVVVFWALRRSGLSRREAGIRVAAFNTLVFGVFCVGAWISAAVLLAGGGWTGRLTLTLPWLIAVPALVLASAALREPSRRRRVRGRLGRRLLRIVSGANAAVELVRTVIRRPRRNAATLVAALVYWAGDVLCLWAGLKAFGGSVPAAALVLGYATGYLASLLPLPFGGVGGVDAAMTLALRLVGVPLTTALLGTLAYRAVSFWLPTLPGLAAFSTLDRLGRQLRQLAPGVRARRAAG